ETMNDPRGGGARRPARSDSGVRGRVPRGAVDHRLDAGLPLAPAPALRRARRPLPAARRVADARGAHRGLPRLSGVPALEGAAAPLLRSVPDRRALPARALTKLAARMRGQPLRVRL